MSLFVNGEALAGGPKFFGENLVGQYTGAASALALDWFFAQGGDTKINFVTGEHLNNT